MIILGIETSCDETAASIIEAEGNIENFDFNVLGSAINSQIEIHKQYGGVFPTLAKREHIKNLPAVLMQALKGAGFENELWDTDYESWNKKNPGKKFPIDLIAVTVGPGLEPALWTGINFAKELGKKWGIPVIGTNHMEGHMVSAMPQENGLESKNRKAEFPAIALLISGGHTELVLLESWNKKEKIGETQDDAVGEAFDKVARMLNLPYPGGPEISKLAEEAREKNICLDKKFPRPMIHSNDFNFSFSGLKTAVLYYIREIGQSAAQKSFSSESPRAPSSAEADSARLSSENFSGQHFPFLNTKEASQKKLAIAREFEDAVIETLISKTKKAIEKFMPKSLIMGGGVIANKALRKNLLDLNNDYPDIKIFIPEKSLTTDNATMIAIAGYLEYLRGGKKDNELRADGNLDFN